MADIIIADATFRAEAKRARTEAQSVETTISNMVDVLTTLCETDIAEGNVAANFKTYTESVQSMQGQLQDILEEEATQIEDFIVKVDTADAYLYGDGTGPGASGEGIVRDFTEERQTHLLELVEDKDELNEEIREGCRAMNVRPTTRAMPSAFRWIDELKDAYTEAGGELAAMVLNNNSTKSQINRIWRDVTVYDAEFATKFATVRDYLQQYKTAVDELAALIAEGEDGLRGKFFVAPKDFRNSCGKITGPLYESALAIVQARMVNADGTPNFEYLETLMNRPNRRSVNSLEYMAMIDLYRKMTPKEMERFIEISYLPVRAEGNDPNNEMYRLSPIFDEMGKKYAAVAYLGAASTIYNFGPPTPVVSDATRRAVEEDLMRSSIMLAVANYGQSIRYDNTVFYGYEGKPPVMISLNEYGNYNLTIHHMFPYGDVNHHYCSQVTVYKPCTAGELDGAIDAHKDDILRSLGGSGGGVKLGMDTGMEMLSYIDTAAVSYIGHAYAGIGLVLSVAEMEQNRHNNIRIDNIINAGVAARGIEMLGGRAQLIYNNTTGEATLGSYGYDEREAFYRYKAFTNECGDVFKDERAMADALLNPTPEQYAAASEDARNINQNVQSGESPYEQYRIWNESSNFGDEARDEYRAQLQLAAENYRATPQGSDFPDNFHDATLDQLKELDAYMNQ